MTLKAQTLWTYHDIDRLPDDLMRYELWNGELIMTPAPSMRHQTIVRRLLWALAAFDPDLERGEYYTAPADVVLAENWSFQPDIFFVSHERLNIVKAQRVMGAPDLCIEILSPSTTQHDATRKRKAYAGAGVREYWLVDPFSEVVSVYVLDGESYALRGEFSSGETLTSAVLEGFTYEVGALFANLPGENEVEE